MIAIDKILHFICCFIIAAVTALLMFGSFGCSRLISLLGGFSFSMLIGFLKEVYDMKKKNTTRLDWGDMKADLIGASIATLFCIFM